MESRDNIIISIVDVVVVVFPFARFVAMLVINKWSCVRPKIVFCSIVRRYGSVFSVTTPHRQKTGLRRNNTNKASKLRVMIRVGAGVGHHDEAQLDHDDDVC